MTESILESGIVAYQQGEATRAIGIFSKIIKQQPENADAWFWLGRCQEDTEKAKFCFERSAYLNQQLTSREYIYVDPDDIPRSTNLVTPDPPSPIVEKIDLHVPVQPQPEMRRTGTTALAQEREINPFLAYPLPEGFVYPRNRNSKLEIALAILLGFLVLIFLIALAVRFL
jgi:hypothetical protein